MKTIFIIAGREWKNYFLSPIAYVYLILFLGVTHWFFFRGFFLAGQNEMRAFFGLMPWIFLFFIPVITMGKWSEERKQGTIEILFTLPIAEREVVLGKFMACLGLLATALLLTFPLPITLAFIGEIDWGPIVGGYLGLLLMGGAYLAIGLWISGLTKNPIIAFILTVVLCFFLNLLGEPIVTLSLPEMWVPLFRFLGLATHFESIGRGVLDSRDLLYYGSVIFLFLFLNHKSLEGRSWK